jgi:fumarate hydratase class II
LAEIRIETDSLGKVEVPADKLWGAQTQGYDKASKIAHHALEHGLTLKQAALQLDFVDEATFDRVVDPAKMVKPYVATATA